MGIRIVALSLALLAAACIPQGGGLGTRTLVNMMPAAPPGFTTGYDFDLLDPVEGKGCIGGKPGEVVYWTSVAGVGPSPRNMSTQMDAAESAAVFDALEKSIGADGFILTRARYETSGVNGICATVWGRGVRLKQAGAADTTAARPPTPAVGAPTPGAK